MLYLHYFIKIWNIHLAEDCAVPCLFKTIHLSGYKNLSGKPVNSSAPPRIFFYWHSFVNIEIIVPNWNSTNAEHFKKLSPIFPTLKFVHSMVWQKWLTVWLFAYIKLKLFRILSTFAVCIPLNPDRSFNLSRLYRFDYFFLFI